MPFRATRSAISAVWLSLSSGSKGTSPKHYYCSSYHKYLTSSSAVPNCSGLFHVRDTEYQSASMASHLVIRRLIIYSFVFKSRSFDKSPIPVGNQIRNSSFWSDTPRPQNTFRITSNSFGNGSKNKPNNHSDKLYDFKLDTGECRPINRTRACLRSYWNSGKLQQ